jgi:hypothetical protein
MVCVEEEERERERREEGFLTKVVIGRFAFANT